MAAKKTHPQMHADQVRDVLATQVSEQLEGVRRSLTQRPIATDGHCQFRAVAWQCPTYGSRAHARLRSDVVAHLKANGEYFRPFFVGNQQ